MIVLFLLFCIVDGEVSQIRFSVPEEQDHGTFVGNIAEDLGMDITKLSARRFQTVPSSRTPYLEVNLENGVLFVNEKIDREEICKQSATCLLHLEVFLEDPLELFRVEIEIVDINDNPPNFPETDILVEISESASPGTRFPLESAFDPDVGTNALRTYEITTNSYFYLDVQTQGDGNKFAELVLEKPLDREQQSVHRYVLTAVDGGLPQRTGTALLVIKVLDSNDNVPVFDQTVYTVSLPEDSPVGTLVDSGNPELSANATVNVVIVDQNDNAPSVVSPLGKNGTAKEHLPRSAEPGYLVTRIVAIDADDSENARLSYSILRGNEMGMFRMDWRTGELRTARRVPSKRDPHHPYDLLIEVRDHGQPPLSSTASIHIMIVDSVVEGHSGDRGSTKTKETSLDLTLILIIALGSVSFIFLLAMIVLAIRCQKDKKLNIYTCLASDCCLICSPCCSRQARARKKKLSKSDIMLVQSSNVTNTTQVPVEESGSFGSHHQNQNYCYQVCLTPESAKTDLMFLKPCSPARSTDTDHNPCGAIVTGYTDQQPDIISNGSILSNEVFPDLFQLYKENCDHVLFTDRSEQTYNLIKYIQ
ncbi:UNVERIFIED_CONTAM: hypothetical protein FKN15_032763 [Acipenser sinensis]